MTLGTTAATWFEGRWHDGNARVVGAADHGAWLGTMVFDGARAFEGVTPDLDLTTLLICVALTAVPYTAASLIPSWRASVTDPDTVLRS